MAKLINVLIEAYVLVLLVLLYLIKPEILIITGILTALWALTLILKSLWFKVGANMVLMILLTLAFEEIIGLPALITILPLFLRLDLILRW